MMIGPYGAGWQVFARPRHEQPTLVERGWGKPVDPEHQQDFVDCVRTRKPSTADVEETHPQFFDGPLRQYELPYGGTETPRGCKDRGRR